MNVAVKVWFHRTRAAVWVIAGIASFPLGWADSVAVVWIASVYANVISDFGAGEAADDRRVLDELCALREQVARLETMIENHHQPGGDDR